jgi:hypothetical protein
MTSVAMTLAEWAAGITPGPDDEELAHRSLLDTVAVPAWTPTQPDGPGIMRRRR